MRIVINGAGEVGSHLAKMLRQEGSEVVVIDNDEARLSRLTSYADVEAIDGYPSSISVLKEAGVDKADLFIAVYPFATHEVNIVSALLAKQLGAARVIARISNEELLTPENKLMFKEMGIELMFYPERIAADEIIGSLKHNATAETMEFARGKLQISVFKLDEDSPLADLTLKEMVSRQTPEELEQFRIIAIYRGNTTIIPTADTRFQYADLVYAISKREGIANLVRLFGKEEIKISRIMLLGGGPISEMVARSLSNQLDEIKIIEKDKERCIKLMESLPDNITVVNGDGRDSDLLYEESIRDFDAFIAVTSNDEENILACVAAKKFGVLRTIAEVENIEYIHLAEEMGVDTVINRKLITASRIFKFTLSGKARSVKYIAGTNAEVIEYTVSPGSKATKGEIRELGFPKGAIIGGIIRGSDSMIAVGNTRIEAYDRVAILALPQTIKEIDKYFK